MFIPSPPMTKENTVSDCCNATMTVEGETTHYYACSKCGKACNPANQNTHRLLSDDDVAEEERSIFAPKFDCNGEEITVGRKIEYLPTGAICKVRRHWVGVLEFVFPNGKHRHYMKLRGKRRVSAGKFPSHQWKLVPKAQPSL